MSNEKQNMVPGVRFPEFEKDAEWSLEGFSEIYSLKVTNSLSRDKLTYEVGEVKNIHYGDIHTKFSTLFDITKESVPYINTDVSIEKIDNENYCKERDMIFADASEDVDDVGKSIEIVNLNSEKLLSGLHTLLARQIDHKLASGFAGYLFKSDGLRNQIKRESQGAKVLGISGTRLSSIRVYYPKDKNEQQKIADCLSSLDDLIFAEKEKLGALEDHRKGLLQELFPVEGETIPQLRFPEFEDDGEWQETTLTQIADYENGKAHEQEISDSGGYIVVNSKFISSEGKVVKHTNSANCLAMEGDILMVLSDVPNGKAIAKCFYVDQEDTYTVNQRICKLTATGVNDRFLFYILNRNAYFLRFDDGVKQTNLRKDDVLNCPLLIPKNLREQEKIVDCLADADNLIEAQSKKITALERHKKGLMQQLFPSINESEV